ncbi:sterol desaturase family protein [Parapedobacter deserti]|uniref:Sterol desaturase family protein n=1 Tax=Parapedobacter deserti TaxID=1912957 RepID=A0ABV7JLY8_9SPHI
MQVIKAVFDSFGVPILAGVFVVLFLIESKFQLRRRVQNRWKRIVINSILSIPAFLLLRLLFIPVMVWLAIKNQTWQIGLNYMLDLPTVVSAMVAFLSLDYSNYLWHILLHRLPVLWRFHLVHHTDLDLDITTAFRFHFGEMIGSVLFRGAAIVLIGASPFMVLIYEIVFEAATQFHHSNIKMPFRMERLLNLFIVTPRMHGIHHSIIKRETDSNYAVIFSVWDRLHRTVRLNVPQDKIVTGVPAYRDEKELTIGNLLILPFTKIRPWLTRLSRHPSEEGNEQRDCLHR